jgi:hypothetical protein
MTTPTNGAPVANLRETKKELAAAKQRHPAGKQAPAKKAAPAAARVSLKWTFPNGKDEFKDGKTQIAPFADGELAILKAGDGWKAVYRVKGRKELLLAEGGFGKC